MKVWAAPYELKFRQPPKNIRQGSLLRFEFEDLGFGYADLFPWPEFRDLDLKTQLAQLRGGKLSPLSVRSLEFARQDAISRKLKRSLFAGLKVPRSHFLFMSPEISRADIEEKSAAGYKTVKIKLSNEVQWLNSLAANLDLRVRLDFNNKLTPLSYMNFVEQLTPQAKSKIDFIEDPTPFENNSWLKLQSALPLALDCGSDKDFTEFSQLGFRYLILKPARQNIHDVEVPPKVKPVFMGYLDHPVGQSFAALEAARAEGEKLDAGLTYHECYERNEYSERLGVKEAHLVPDGGFGIGFGDLLEKEDWEFIYAN